MNANFFTLLVTGALLVSPAMAQARTWRRCPPPVVPYSNYQGPDGTYDSYSDFIRDLRGRPCGIDCTRRAEQRWARYYRHCTG